MQGFLQYLPWNHKVEKTTWHYGKSCCFQTTVHRKYKLFERHPRRLFIRVPCVQSNRNLRDQQQSSASDVSSTTPANDLSSHTLSNPSMNKLHVNQWKTFVLGLTVVVILSYLCLIRGNGDFSIMDATEPKFAVTAREMLQRGDWLTPQWNNRLRFDKPPLTYWLMAISYKVFGLTEFATRLPTSLAGTFMALGIYFAGWKFAPVVENTHCRLITGLVSSTIFLCNLFTVGWSRAGVSDMLLCFHVGAALLSFFAGYSLSGGNASYESTSVLASSKNDHDIVLATNHSENLREMKDNNTHLGKFYYFMFFVFCALAVLTKGPLGVFLPVCILSIFLWATGTLKQVVLSEVPWIPGILSGALISLPWYILIIQKHGWKFIQSFFGYHNMNRLTSAVNGHTGPFYYYLPISLIGLSPWIFLVPAAILFYRPFDKQRWKTSDEPRSSQFPLFLCIWILFIYIFFSSIRTKLLSYVIPAVPAVSLLVGLFFGTLHSNSTEWTKSKTIATAKSQERRFQVLSSLWNENTCCKLFATLTVLWMFTCSTLSFFVVQFAERASGDPVVLSACIQQLKYHKFAWRGGIPWLLAGLFSLYQLGRRKKHTRYADRMRWLFVPLSIGFLSFLLFFIQPAIKVWDSAWQQPLKELSQIANTVSTNQKELYMLAYGQCDGDMEGQPSVVWYSQRNWKSHEDPKQFLTKLAQVKDPDIVALVEHRLWKKVPQQAATSLQRVETLAQRGGFSLVRLSPETARAILRSWGQE